MLDYMYMYQTQSVRQGCILDRDEWNYMAQLVLSSASHNDLLHKRLTLKWVEALQP